MNVKSLVLGPVGTNTYLAEKDGEYLIVDPAYDSPQLDELIKGKEIKYILLTHGHFDHIGGLEKLQKATSAKTVIHELDAEMLEDGKKSRYADFFFGIQTPLYADIKLKGGEMLPFGKGSIKVMHTPGHTHGSVVYIFEEDKAIFTGDTLFRLSVGRTDLCDGDMRENSRREMESVKKISEIPGDYIIYPGHGEETNLDYEREFNPYMRG